MLAQDRPPPPPSFSKDNSEAMIRHGFNLGFTAGQEVAAEVMRLRARIAELEKLCGDPCKPKELGK